MKMTDPRWTEPQGFIVDGGDIADGDMIKVVTCGITEEHRPHFWHGGARFCPAGEIISGEAEIEVVANRVE